MGWNGSTRRNDNGRLFAVGGGASGSSGRGGGGIGSASPGNISCGGGTITGWSGIRRWSGSHWARRGVGVTSRAAWASVRGGRLPVTGVGTKVGTNSFAFGFILPPCQILGEARVQKG